MKLDDGSTDDGSTNDGLIGDGSIDDGLDIRLFGLETTTGIRESELVRILATSDDTGHETVRALLITFRSCT